MSEDRLLAQLNPPAGGWQRLLSRREAALPRHRLAFPLALAASLAALVFVARPPSQRVELPWSGGRLVAQQSEGRGLRRVSEGRATTLPSDNPHVLLYWVEETGRP